MEHQSGESKIRMAAEQQILPRNRLSCFYSRIRGTGSHLTFISFDLMQFSLPSFDFGSEPSLFLPVSLSFTKDFFCVSFDVIQQDIRVCDSKSACSLHHITSVAQSDGDELWKLEIRHIEES